MGRRRIHRRDLPERMYCDKGVYYFWPKGRPKHWFRDADGRPLSLAAALAEYGRLVDRPVIVVTMADLIDEFERSAAFAALAERTQVDRRRHHAELRSVFGHYEPHELEQVDILEWKRARAPQAPRQWNQALSALKVLMGYAADPLGLVTANPCREVKRMPEPRRTRAPSLAELEAFCALGSEQVRLYVALKLLTSLRMSDILRIPAHCRSSAWHSRRVASISSPRFRASRVAASTSPAPASPTAASPSPRSAAAPPGSAQTVGTRPRRSAARRTQAPSASRRADLQAST
jgi:hypothetical protein